LEIAMLGGARSALVLQGGGALGAYELGAARTLYGGHNLAPDLIAGVSIGAIAAALLARPKARKPLEALEEFWRQVTVPGSYWLPQLKPYASFLGNPNFFMPHIDCVNWHSWTSFYDTAPLRRTLENLVDVDRLADKNAVPRLLMGAINLEEGEIEYFFSNENSLTLDHVMASGSLPPAFPMTAIKQQRKTCYYWDCGPFDNTPLGAVLDRLDDTPHVDRTIYVINLFPTKGSVPKNLSEVLARMINLQFANKTAEDVKLMCRMNQVAELLEALERLPINPLAADPAYRSLKKQKYIRVPKIVSISAPQLVDEFAAADFSPEAINKRAEDGEKLTRRVLTDPNHDPCSGLM
jgi:NTE family protein